MRRPTETARQFQSDHQPQHGAPKPVKAEPKRFRPPAPPPQKQEEEEDEEEDEAKAEAALD